MLHVKIVSKEMRSCEGAGGLKSAAGDSLPYSSQQCDSDDCYKCVDDLGYVDTGFQYKPQYVVVNDSVVSGVDCKAIHPQYFNKYTKELSAEDSANAMQNHSLNSKTSISDGGDIQDCSLTRGDGLKCGKYSKCNGFVCTKHTMHGYVGFDSGDACNKDDIVCNQNRTVYSANISDVSSVYRRRNVDLHAQTKDKSKNVVAQPITNPAAVKSFSAAAVRADCAVGVGVRCKQKNPQNSVVKGISLLFTMIFRVMFGLVDCCALLLSRILRKLFRIQDLHAKRFHCDREMAKVIDKTIDNIDTAPVTDLAVGVDCADVRSSACDDVSEDLRVAGVDIESDSLNINQQQNPSYLMENCLSSPLISSKLPTNGLLPVRC